MKFQQINNMKWSRKSANAKLEMKNHVFLEDIWCKLMVTRILGNMTSVEYRQNSQMIII